MKEDYTIKIINLCDGMSEYLKEAASDKDADLKELWLKNVIDPQWNEWAAGQFNEERTRTEMQDPFTELEKLLFVIEQLRNSGIDSIIENSYRAMTEILPPVDNSKVVCIFADPNLGENVRGVVGNCVGNHILLRINAALPGWEAVVPWVIAHEYHHSLWGYNYFYKKGNTQADLLTGLIIDGQADSFAKSLNCSIDVPWTSALTEQQEIEQWAIMQDYLSSTDGATYCRFFFGDEKENTPGCTAYTIGYHIVQAYLEKHPDIHFIDLMDKSACEILAESGYDGRPRLK